MENLSFEEVYEKALKVYNKEYAEGEHCHKQSFIWGFQEGIEYAETNRRISQMH